MYFQIFSITICERLIENHQHTYGQPLTNFAEIHCFFNIWRSFKQIHFYKALLDFDQVSLLHDYRYSV